MEMCACLILSLLLLFPMAREARSCSLTEVECDGACRTACDSHIECADGRDESPLLCKERQCAPDESITLLGSLGIGRNDLDVKPHFRCNYGGCIPHLFMCNGHQDCWDGSDETEELCLHHVCPRRSFKCKYGGCLKRLKKCDGVAQCHDGSDEDPALCRRKRCISSQFRCSYGACINKREACNGISDCFDSSDEDPELCGQGHTFQKIEARIPIPRALASLLDPLLATPQPTTLPPPPTTTTQPPPPPTTTTQPPPQTTTTTQPTTTTQTTTTTQPTTTTQTTTTTQSPSPSSTQPHMQTTFSFADDVLPDEGLYGCDGAHSCPCPPPLQHFCVPCDGANDTCARIGEEAVCRMPSRGAPTGIEVEVLSCGAGAFLSLAGMVRADRECGTSEGVPVLTVVTADCWGATTLLAECHADGLWHPYGEPRGAKPMRHLCQPSTLNADVCGKRARYVKPPGRYTPYETASQWPWLAGLFRREKYACSAALVTPSYLLTAAHCLTRTQETSQETIDLRDLRVQHLNERGNVVKGYVTAVHLYPAYESGTRPSRDIALVRLEKPVSFSRKLVPACVLEGAFPRHDVAATFNRTIARFRWELILQQHDPRCHSPWDRCASALKVDRDQFCGIDKGHQKYLPEGSSGGPYLVNVGSDVDEKWAVAGVVSSSYGETSCSRPYTIFTAAGNYWPWIERCVYLGNCSQPLQDDGE